MGVLYVIPAAPLVVETDATPSPLDRVFKTARDAHLGAGLVRPFRRDEKSDFANSSGAALVKSCVGQILNMRGAGEFTQGELPWEPERGSLLYLLRHQANDIALRELARVYVVEALRRWEPRVRVKRVEVTREEVNAGEGLNVLLIRLVYDIIATNVPGNEVFLPDVQQTLTLQLAA